METNIEQVERDRSLKAPADQPSELNVAKVRVAWVSGASTLEQLSRTLEPLAIGLMDEMVDVTLLCSHRADASGLSSPPLHIIRHDYSRWHVFASRIADSLAEELKSRKVDLLHAMDARSLRLTRSLAKAVGVPYIVTACALGDARRLGHLHDAGMVIAASEPIHRELLAEHVAPAEKVVLLRPGVHRVAEARCFLQPDRSAAILAGGNMRHAGPFEAVLRAFARLQSHKHDCVFFVMGNGSAERRLWLLAERLGLQGELTFVDHQPASQMPGIFTAADVFISLVPRQEIDSASLLAMASGVPVLASGAGASDYLIDGRTAMLFTQGDDRELADKLEALLVDKSAGRQLAANGLAHLGENHRIGEMVLRLTDIYRRSSE